MAPALQVSITRLKKGTSLTEALAAIEWGLPRFFVPMVQTGEQTGRMDEALRHLERHCRLLVAPSNAMRNAWAVPLAIMLFGSIVQLNAHFIFAPWTATIAFVFSTCMSYAILAGLAFVALSSPTKPMIDQFKLLLPVIRDVEPSFLAGALRWSATPRVG